jgi:hypothetical protein
MKFSRKQMNGLSVLLIIIVFLSITILALSDSLLTSLLGVGLIVTALVLLVLFIKSFHGFEKIINIEKVNKNSLEIDSIESKITIDHMKDILVKKSYSQTESSTNEALIFRKKNRYIVLNLSNEIKTSFEFLYDFYYKSKGDIHIMEFYPIIIVSNCDTRDLNLLSEYYRKARLDEDGKNNIMEYISEDGSGFSNPSLFHPMILIENKLYYIKNAQSDEILRLFELKKK